VQELAWVLATTVVVAGLLSLATTWIEPWLTRLENGLTFLSTALILFTMAFVCAEVAMRYGFNAPIQGHLEGSELLVPIVVFFAVSYTQARNGHVGMTLLVDNLPERWHRTLDVVTLSLSVLICAVLAWFGSKYAFQLYQYDDVTMTPPYWRTWPSAAAISLGYLMLAVRMWFQVLHVLNPERFPQTPADEVWELHSPE
jgi:TRAP-type C4-dicarboxylate transport system permease small subunit